MILSAKVRRVVLSFLKSDAGPTAVEYAIMISLVFAACLTVVGFLGQNTQTSFSKSANSVNSAIKGTQ